MKIAYPLFNFVLRGCDHFGCGHFGASRGNRTHKGLDLVSTPNEDVFSPIDGKITKYGYPYADHLEYRYIEITNDEFRVRLFYCELREDLFQVGDKVFQGDGIGKAQNISQLYTTKNKIMRNHLHLEIYQHKLLVDPNKFLS